MKKELFQLHIDGQKTEDFLLLTRGEARKQNELMLEGSGPGYKYLIIHVALAKEARKCTE